MSVKKTKKSKGKSINSTKEVARQEVKMALSRALERKSSTALLSGIALGNAINATTFNANNTFPLTPYTNVLAIAQGNTQGTRVGNIVKPVKASMKLHLFLNPYTASTNTVPIPQVVEIYIFSLKGVDQAFGDAVNAVSNSAGTFFQAGASYSGFGGDNLDALKETNPDSVTVYYHKRIKLGSAQYSDNTGAQANQFFYTNNDFKLFHEINVDLMKHGFPKKLIFNDTNTIATSRALYCVISPWDSDGGANPDTTSAIPLNMDMRIHVDYTDA